MFNNREDLIPYMLSNDAKQKNKSYQSEWVKFARKMQKNPYMKEYIFSRHKGRCQWCKKNIQNEFVLHHVDYDHICRHPHNIRISSSNKRTHLNIPDCENCCKTNRQLFMECARRVACVHNLCNKLIDERSKRPSKHKVEQLNLFDF